MSWQPKNAIYSEYLALKYDPPTIAIFYRTQQQAKKKRVYYILLNDLIYLEDASDITGRLYQEHPMIVNPQNVEYTQIKDMVVNIKKVLSSNQNYENQLKLRQQQWQQLQQPQQPYPQYNIQHQDSKLIGNQDNSQIRNQKMNITPNDPSKTPSQQILEQEKQVSQQLNLNINAIKYQNTEEEYYQNSKTRQTPVVDQHNDISFISVNSIDNEQDTFPTTNTTNNQPQQKHQIHSNQNQPSPHSPPKRYSLQQQPLQSKFSGKQQKQQQNSSPKRYSVQPIAQNQAQQQQLSPRKQSSSKQQPLIPINQPQQQQKSQQKNQQLSLQQQKKLRYKKRRSGGGLQNSMVNDSYYNQGQLMIDPNNVDSTQPSELIFDNTTASPIMQQTTYDYSNTPSPHNQINLTPTNNTSNMNIMNNSPNKSQNNNNLSHSPINRDTALVDESANISPIPSHFHTHKNSSSFQNNLAVPQIPANSHKNSAHNLHIGDQNPIIFDQNLQNSVEQVNKNHPKSKLKNLLSSSGGSNGNNNNQRGRQYKKIQNSISSSGNLEYAPPKKHSQQASIHSQKHSSKQESDLGGGYLDNYFFQNKEKNSRNNSPGNQKVDDFYLGSSKQSQALRSLKQSFENENINNQNIHQLRSSNLI